MHIDKRIVRDFLINWLKLLAIISGFVGAIAFVVWTMILGETYFGGIGWIGVMILWIAGVFAALLTSLENDRRKRL